MVPSPCPTPVPREQVEQLELLEGSPADPRAELLDPAVTVRFMLAGNAHVTFQSRRTGDRYTYRVERAPSAAELRPGDTGTGTRHFVSGLVGPDNGRNYKYLGTIFDGRFYAHGRRSTIDRDAIGAIAFPWVWRKLIAGKMHPELAVYHEGRCSRCNRRLTDPLSISTGLGPTCRELAGG